MQTVNFTGNFKRRWQFAKQFFQETQTHDFWIDVHKFARSMTKNFFEITLEEEMIQYQQRESYQRTPSRLDYRNGHYTRNFDTAFGLPACTTANGCFEKHKMSAKESSNSGWALEIALDELGGLVPRNLQTIAQSECA